MKTPSLLYYFSPTIGKTLLIEKICVFGQKKTVDNYILQTSS